jgi:hypothetical protein
MLLPSLPFLELHEVRVSVSSHMGSCAVLRAPRSQSGISDQVLPLCCPAGEWKRNYLSALSASVDTVLPFLVKLLQVGLRARCPRTVYLL